MPDIKTHCDISQNRTKHDFRELHEWIDQPKEFLGVNHRIERHSFQEAYKNYIKSKWGEKAVIEWLFHIALDNLETANKYAVENYNKAYEKIMVEFEGKQISKCNFTKLYANSSRTSTYDKNAN